MSKISVECKKGKYTIINRIAYPETINERVFNTVAAGMVDGFLPMTIRQKRKETRLECMVQGLIPLSKYFDCVVSKSMFLDFVYEIARIIKTCEVNKLDVNNLDLQKDRIFLDPNTLRVKCVFWPLVNNQKGATPNVFLRQLPAELNFNPFENKGYLDTYLSYFNSMNPFSANGFEKLVSELAGKKSAEGSKKVTSESKADKNTQGFHQNKDNIEYDPFATMEPEKPVKKQESEIQMETDPYESTMMFDEFERTRALGKEEYSEPVFPQILRTKTKEAVAMMKPVIKIGTDAKICDFVVTGNNFISRRHAEILRKNGKYYVVDCKSTNFTFLNGKQLISLEETELELGDIIRLANEDFLFDIIE